MRTLALSALALLLASPALAADAGKPSTSQIQGPPPVQSDAVKPLTDPAVVKPPASKPVPPPKPVAAPKATPPAPDGGPAVSGPKVTPGAPAVGPTAPTIPAAGVPGIDPRLRDANQAGTIRDLKQLEDLHRNPMQRGAPAGTSEGGLPSTLGTGSLTTPPAHQGPAGGLGRDCLANPQDCIGGGAGGPHEVLGGTRGGSGSGSAAGRLGGPPTIGGGVPDPRGPVSSGNFTAVNIERRPSGSYHATGTYAHGGGRAEFATTGVRDPEGNWHFHTLVVGFDEKGKFLFSQITTSTVDSQGNTTQSGGSAEGAPIPAEVVEAGDALIQAAQNPGGSGSGGSQGGGSGNPAGTTPTGSQGGGGSASQPREDPAGGSGGNDGCSWAPIHGCLNPRQDIRTTIRQQTTQPGINPDGQGTEGGVGSSGGPRTGPEAVTNTGDGSFGVQRAGNQAGTPIWKTMPDPVPGGPGGPAVGSPVRRAGSDAGIDAGTGALPSPPPPPR